MIVGVTKIAKQANISKGIVSRYLNADPKLKIKPETMARIDKAKRLFDSVRVEKNVEPLLVGNFVIPINATLRNISMAEIINTFGIKPLEQVLEKSGFSVSIIFVDDNNKEKTINRLIKRSSFCNGIIFLTAMANKELAKIVLDNNIPHVSIDPHDETLGLNTVLAHSILGIRQAIEHLVDLGHKNIGYIGKKGFYRCTRFFTAMLESGLQFSDELNIYLAEKSENNLDINWRDIAADGFLSMYDESSATTAYICQDDKIAFGVMDAMRGMGLVPGKDISLVGYNNIGKHGVYYGDNSVLTTIDNPTEIIGKRCGEILIGQVSHKQMDIIHEYIPAPLVIRKTTDVFQNNRKLNI